MFRCAVKYLFVLILLFLESTSFGQNESKKWFFGYQCGLDFSTSPPTVLTGGIINAGEGCATISDNSGNLLMYTDGVTVYNAQHTVMANGTGLNGGFSTSQSAVIIKKPGASFIYYIFTLEPQIGYLCYSTVDMSMASGNGSVTAKNFTLHASCSEKMVMAPHCNGSDFWLIAHEFNSNNFLSYSVSAAGVNTVPIVTPIGSTYSIVLNGVYDYYGNLKVSSQGNRIATSVGSGKIEVFDFNPSIGVLSNSFSIVTPRSYGCEFSPDGTKLYSTYASSNIIGTLAQWDLCAGSSSAIVASQYSINLLTPIGGMQLGPDNRIYVARGGISMLGVILSPDSLGAACNYTHNGLALSSGCTCRENLPNFTFRENPPTPILSSVINNSLGCQGVAFNASLNANTTCVSSSYSVVGYNWTFGDPISGGANTSTLASPVHAFSSIGNYSVGLAVDRACGGLPDTAWQTVSISVPCITLTTHTITCASLGSATVGATSGAGPFSYTWMPGNQTGSVATGLSPGSYTVTVHDLGTNFTYTAYTVFTSLIPLTANIVHSNAVPCYGVSSGTGNVTNVSGGSSTEYYWWTNGNQSYTTSLVNALYASTWSVTVTDALTACKVQSVLVISQPPATTVGFASGSANACAGTSVILTATASGGTPPFSYNWINGPASKSITVSENAGGTFIYSLTTTDSNSCAMTHTTAYVFTPNPTLSVAHVSICPLEAGTLSVTGASTYTWSNNSSSSSLTDNPLATTQYTVTGSAQGCPAAATASIVLKPSPVALISSNSPRCENASVLMVASGGVAYNWNGPSGFVSSVALASIQAVSPNQAGVYNVTVTAANGCTASASSTLVVDPTPTVSAAGSTVCTSQTLNLGAASVPGASFLWTGPLNFISVQQNPSLNTPVVGATGNYTVKATSMQGCTNTAVAHGLVVPPPNMQVSLSSPSLCAQAFNGSPNTITLTSSGANTYTLLTGAPILNTDPTNSVAPLTTNPPFLPTGLATATLLGSNGVCTVSLTPSFSIIPNPAITATTPTPVICAGKTLTYTSNGADSYTWTSSTPNFTTYSNGGVAVTHPSIMALFSVFGTSLGCQSALLTTSINVYPLPTVLVTPTSTAVCLHSSATLQASGSATQYTWLPATGLNQTNGDVVLASPSANLTYTVIGSALGCTNSATGEVKVLPLPLPKATLSGTAICLNERITLSAKGGSSYEWYGPEHNHYSGSPVSFVVTHPAFAGEYTLVATDSNGCKGSTRTVFELKPLPNGYLTGIKDECVPFCGTYSFVAMNGADLTADWQVFVNSTTGQKAVRTIGRTTQFVQCFSKEGQYTLAGKLLDQNTGCRSTQTFVINAFEKPLADFTWSPDKPVEGLDDVHFENASKGNEQTKWSWYFSNDHSFKSTSENTSYMFQKAGTYPVAMVVENKWGCRDTALKVLTIDTDFAIFVPNAFTPNADSRNEVFKPSVRGVTKYYFQVFNRWGERLFVTENPEEGWDGFYNGQLSQQGSYVWKASLITASGEMKELKGAVILIE
jgi:gliding motility-associated-like protein